VWSSYVVTHVWALLSVSFVAQMATFPLLLYYFHKISLSFLLANVLVIPISTVIIWLSLALICTSLFPCGLTVFIGVVLTKLTWLMNYIALSIGNYKYGSLSDVSFTSLECLLLYLLMIVMLVYLKFGKLYFLYLTLLVLVLGWSVRTLMFWKYHKQCVLVAYSIKNNSLLLVIKGQQSKMYFGKPIDNYTKKNMRDFLNSHGVNQLDKCLQSKNKLLNCTSDSLGYQLIHLKVAKLLIIKSDKLPLFDQKIEYLQLINNPAIDWQLIVQHYPHSKVIIDKSNAAAYAYRLEKYLSSRNILVHNMYTKGAFVVGE
jgi:competence protein ComEC